MTKSTNAKIRPRQPGMGLSLLAWIFRLLLLGVGSGAAWLVGIAIAQVYPAPNPQMPLVEQWLRHSLRLAPSLKPLSNSTRPLPASPTPQTTATPSLSETQRQQLQAQLKQLQGDLNTLIGRTTQLETQLGGSRPADPLEKRLELVAQQLTALDPGPPLALPSPTVTPGTNASPPAMQESILAEDALMVTLPSDILFNPGSSALRPGSRVILDNLIADLRNYQGARIQVAAHTDNIGLSGENRDLSLQRAEAILQYLSTTLGVGYHWVAVGYGGSRPSTDNTTEINRQRNRRVEVLINP